MWVSLQYGASGTLGCGTVYSAGMAPLFVSASSFTTLGLVLWFEPALKVFVLDARLERLGPRDVA